MPSRYVNLFRLIVAGLFVVAGQDLNLGAEAPPLYFGLSLAYLVVALVLGLPGTMPGVDRDRLIALQLIIDIIALTGIMAVSGGFRSGMPLLMMVYLAGAGLISEGRTGLLMAALATIGVLGENLWRTFAGQGAAEFLQVGISCAGFFAIAITSRLLARRARLNEALAAERGRALDRQQAINERIIEDLRDGVIVISEEGKLRQANPRARALLGGALLTGTPLAAVDPRLLDSVRHPHGNGQVQRFGPAGSLLRCRAVSAGAGNDGDTVIYLTDYSELQDQVQQLKLASLGRLTASMAHEIRNPLSAIIQAADLLLEEEQRPVQGRLTRIINDNARRIEGLVREVLALGRRAHTEVEALPLADCVAEVVDAFGLNSAAQHAVFAVNIDAGATFAIDRAHMHQILHNLLGNAHAHASGKPGSVQVSSVALAGGRICVHVIDDGPGISAEQQEHIFEPFFTTQPKGVGLGLYIARELAEANGAQLEFAGNQPGAHFTLTGRSQP